MQHVVTLCSCQQLQHASTNMTLQNNSNLPILPAAVGALERSNSTYNVLGGTGGRVRTKVGSKIEEGTRHGLDKCKASEEVLLRDPAGGHHLVLQQGKHHLRWTDPFQPVSIHPT